VPFTHCPKKRAFFPGYEHTVNAVVCGELSDRIAESRNLPKNLKHLLTMVSNRLTQGVGQSGLLCITIAREKDRILGREIVFG
jgi:hypothetical protein